MDRSECSGQSFTGSEKQSEVTSIHAEKHKERGEMQRIFPHPSEKEREQTEEEDEEIKRPVELKIEFLRALRERDFEQACKLCQMILIYEPENPEASEFLPLIKRRLLEEHEAEQSSSEENEEDEEEDEDSDASGSDEESSESSSCSSVCSSSSPTDEEDNDGGEEQLNRHKLCPPSQIYK
ncbi:glutamate-rich protein 2 isoform X2 [Xyrichtys novacula]|uniref:Glutamate-rich protein 2 isoform X2 n=1 Tax=Xyrichtys novacula TaxID=13765 RepID=A0AAV1GGL1_XYRNO|nr:glutamate-rich protein 2 isoform X2 [Xyrichtys novacula]